MISDLYTGLTRTNFSLEGIEGVPENPDIEQLLEILTQNNRKDEVIDIVAKHIMRSVLDDFVQFVYESLDAIRHGRFSVAYALLRKPFVDELFMFEQIWVDKADFVERYYFQGDTKLYDPSDRTISDSTRKSIIETTINKLKYPSDFNANTVYEYRYDKSVKYGMNWVSNQALHIVTNHSKYKTLNRELNFVFANTEDYKNLWEHYYSVVSYLLQYAVTIIDEIVFGFLPDKIHRKHIKATRRVIIQSYQNDMISGTTNQAEELFKILSRELAHTCKKCGSSIEFGPKEFTYFMLQDKLPCLNCRINQFTDNEFQDKFLALG
jgi:predicted nucleic-acid-binding Zn-ribbon protein